MTRLKDKLEEAVINQAEFSRLSDTPYGTILNWTSGRRKVPGIAFKFLELYLKWEQLTLRGNKDERRDDS